MTEFRYNMSTVNDGYLGLLQGANGFMDGFMGLALIVVFGIIIFSLMVLFGDVKSAFTASAFLSVLVAYGFVAIEILTMGAFIGFVALVVIGIAVMMISNQ